MNGKVALVTGGTAGIGRATAVAFAQQGASVVVVGRGQGDETLGLIKDSGGTAAFVKADVSRPADVEALVNQTIATFGRLDYAFNNAGMEGAAGTVVECTEENWDRIMDVNLKGVWMCMKYQIPQMLKQGGGAIVNNSSLAGLTSLPGRSAYTASKYGVIGLTKAAALEFARSGIRINAVCPGFVLTEMTARAGANEAQQAAALPLGRAGRPEDIANAVIWLCSEAASFLTGHALPLDGGKTAER